MYVVAELGNTIVGYEVAYGQDATGRVASMARTRMY